MSAAFAPGNAPAKIGARAGRFVMIGGFFGAGKTTLASRLGSHLMKAGQSVAFITNDHGSEILDTRILRANGFTAVEVSGGSLASRFDALTSTSAKLGELSPPDTFIIEPVGSSADLLATVNYPLGRLYGKNDAIAPFSVVVDASAAALNLGLDGKSRFSDQLGFLFRQQLQEADFILLNKIDLATAGELTTIRNWLRRDFSQARLFEVSARTGAGLDAWFQAVKGERSPIRAAGVNELEKYGAAEAAMGCLNCSVQLSALKGFQCNPILREWAKTIQRALKKAGIEIAHLKMILSADVDVDGVARLHAIGNDLEPELGDELAEPVERGVLRMSLRAECKPDLLNSVVTDALTHLCSVFPNVFVRLAHSEHFRATPTKPVHRISEINVP